MFTKWLKVGMSDMHEWKEEVLIWYDMIWYDMIWYDMIWYDMIWYDFICTKCFGTKQDFIPLFFIMYVQILWQGQKAVLTIVEFEFLISSILNFN